MGRISPPIHRKAKYKKEMIASEHKNLARETMDFALQHGANARISIISGTNSAFEYRDNTLDKLQQAAENRMEIELFVDSRYGSYSTNRMDRESLFKFTLSAIESTRYLDKDPEKTLPEFSRCYQGKMFTLDTYDPDFKNIAIDAKLELAKNQIDEIFGVDERIISISSEYNDGESFLYMIASNGFEGETAHSTCSLYASVAMKGANDSRPSAYWHDSALYLNDLTTVGIGKTAYEKTLQKLNQTKIASGKYPMLLDNTQSVRLLTPLISALNGYALQQENSFLIDKLNEKIISEKVTVVDNPHIDRAFGARMFDDEGVATKKRNIIEKGILNTYFIDTYISKKMNIQPTISSPSVVVFEPGKRPHTEIMADMDTGIWVTGFNGGNSNSSTGDFSFGIEGFLVENGKPVKPVNEMNITGNILSLWNSVLEVGNDPKLNSSKRVPSILFDGVDFSGI
jgi:PmbA protein